MVDRTLDKLITALPLKEMDGTLLQRAIELEEIKFNKVDPFQFPFNYVQVSKAMQTASYLHRSQTRANRANLPRTHYIEHPLRNALRLLRWGCADQDLIIAALLHDTIEDSLLEYFELEGDHETPVSWTGREVAYDYILRHFGRRVADLVLAVTNPEKQEGVRRTQHQKRTEYAIYVVKAIEDPHVALLKLTDFIDNAAGLHHNDTTVNHAMVSHLAQKYYPLIGHFEDRLEKKDMAELLPAKSLEAIKFQLYNAGRTLNELAILH